MTRAPGVETEGDEGPADAERTGLEEGDSEHKFARIFNVASNAMAFTEAASGRIVDVNRSWCEQMGVPREQAIGTTATELGLWPNPETRRECMDALAARGRLTDFESTLLTRGEPRAVVTSAEHVLLANGDHYVLWEFRDVTERRRMERELAESQHRFRAIFDQSFQFIGLLDTEGRMLQANRSALEFAGLEESDVLGVHFWETPWWRDDPEGQLRLRAAVVAARAGEFVRFETAHHSAAGELRHIDFSLKPVRDASGAVTLLIPEGRDITALKQSEAESRQLLEGMRQAQKLESLGLLAGGIAHDFNNLLTAMLGNASLAEMELPPGSPAFPLLAEIRRAARRASDLAQQMLAYAGRGARRVERMRLDTMLREMHALLQSSISRKATVELHLEPAWIEGDGTQIRQIAMNLITNASDAIGGRDGVISIRTGERWMDADALKSQFSTADLAPGRYGFLEVEDTGCGIADDILSRIFDPFFTTKFTGRGLGLSAVLGIVRGHGGALHVTSTVGQGTRFRVFLPAGADAAESASAAIAEPDLVRGEGLVLVVEDEPSIRTFLDRVLRRAGYETVLAVDGLDAMRLFETRQVEIRAVLLDLTMPHMDGTEVLERLDALGCSAPVLLMSGYNSHETSARNSRRVAAFLQKPFPPGELLDALSRALASRERL